MKPSTPHTTLASASSTPPALPAKRASRGPRRQAAPLASRRRPPAAREPSPPGRMNPRRPRARAPHQTPCPTHRPTPGQSQTPDALRQNRRPRTKPFRPSPLLPSTRRPGAETGPPRFESAPDYSFGLPSPAPNVPSCMCDSALLAPGKAAELWGQLNAAVSAWLVLESVRSRPHEPGDSMKPGCAYTGSGYT